MNVCIDRALGYRQGVNLSPIARCLLALMIFFIAGCTVGPDFQRPVAPDVTGYTKVPLPEKTPAEGSASTSAQYFKSGMEVSALWWTLFHSPALNALIDQGLKNNSDVQAAQAALRVAQENVYAQQAAYYPAVGVSASAVRQKTPVASVTTNATSGASVYSLYTPQVSVSYMPDVFGLNRRTVESLEAQAESQRFQLEATYLTLTSNIVVAAVQEAALREQIGATQKIIDIENEQLTLMRQQHALGAIAELAVTGQEAALAQVQAQLPLLQKQLAQQRDLLTALVGRFPSDAPAETFELAALQLPQALPLSLPAQLVEQRPDIRSAQAQLHAASAQVGVAMANRLPNLTLNADLGSSALALNQLFSAGTGFWSGAGNLAQPVFEGGTLLHRQRAAQAAYDQAAAQYRSTVIVAFQNVADVLHAIQADAEVLHAVANAAAVAGRALDIARRQMQLGAISYLAMLNAEQTFQQAQINLAQAQAARYVDTAALFQALGGGWWNRAGVE